MVSTDTVEGEELTARLVAVAESDVPTVDAPRMLVRESVPPGAPEHLLPFAVRGSSPRAPPVRSSSE